MHALFALLLVVSSALAYQVTYPGAAGGWNTTGPNILEWESVDTDPPTFAAFLVNEDSTYSEILATSVDGTAGIATCPPPQGGWPTGSAYRVNLAQNSTNPDALLAQSTEFNITAVSSNQTTTSASGTQTGTATSTASGTSVSSSDTSTSPTSTSAASLSADTRVGFISAVAVLMALVTSLL